MPSGSAAMEVLIAVANAIQIVELAGRGPDECAAIKLQGICHFFGTYQVMLAASCRLR